MKTGLLDDCFDEQEVNAIREKLQERPNVAELHACEKALDTVNKACSIGMAILATAMLS